MPRKVIYLASRAHSGSTMVSLMLSGHPRLVGLGEIFSLLDFNKGYLFQQDQVTCSCGNAMNQCSFWAPVASVLVKNQNLPINDLYALVINAFFEYFGDGYIPVDASKTLDGLKVSANSPCSLNVLWLLRDVRSWTLSMRNDRIRKNDFYIKDLIRQYGVKTPLEVVMRTPYKYFWHWYLLNRQTQQYLDKENIPTFQLGYEEVSLYPELVAQKVCQFLDIDYDEKMLSLDTAGSHVLLGNRMRNQEEKRTRIFYDNRWFYINEWQLPSLLFPNIMKYNAREVYSNTNTYLWHKG